MFGVDPRVARAVWTVFLVAAVLAAAYLARDTLFIVVLAIFLAYLVYPAVRALDRRVPRLSRAVAAALVFLALIAIAVGLSVSVGQRVSQQASALAERLPELLKDPHITDRVPLPEWMEPLRARIVEVVREQVTQSGGANSMSFARRVGTSVLHFASNVVYVVIIPILGFMSTPQAGCSSVSDRFREANRFPGCLRCDVPTAACFETRSLLSTNACLFEMVPIDAALRNEATACGRDMDLKLGGKRALLLASSKGLGRAAAEALAAEGAAVAISSSNLERCRETADSIARAYGTKAVAIAADMFVPENMSGA